MITVTSTSRDLWTGAGLGNTEAIQLSIASGTFVMSEVTDVLVDWYVPGASSPIVWSGLDVISSAAGLLVVSHSFASDGSDVPTVGHGYSGLVRCFFPLDVIRRAVPIHFAAKAWR